MTKKQYKVAEHIFSIEMPSDASQWLLMEQYSPFECKINQPSIFELTAVEDISRMAGELIGSFESEMVDMTIYKQREQQLQVDFARPHCEASTKLAIDIKKRKAEIYFSTDGSVSIFGLNNAIMLLYTIFTTPHKTLLIHASVAIYKGKGYVFQGQSGTGKSTHNRLWRENIDGTELLNDDNPVLQIVNDRAMVYGSPWSGKTPCYRNVGVPLCAIIRIVQAPENRIEKLRAIEGFASLLASCSSIRWDNDLQKFLHHTIGQVVEMTPSFKLECLADVQAAKLCNKVVTQ